MNSELTDSILNSEMESLKADIISAYNASGKRTSGEFEKGLSINLKPNQARLSGYVYLAGRIAGKQPPTKPIIEWLLKKGIRPLKDKMKITSLAYLIARKIGTEGTKKENHLSIYDQVITPERIQSILEKINKINVTAFVNEVSVLIKKLVVNK